MIRQRATAALLILGALIGYADPPSHQSFAADPTPDPKAVAILQALQSNPLTAPYRFAVTPVGRQYALSGRVASKQAHDVAIRLMIALGYPVRDDLTIDTSEGFRVAIQAQMQAQLQAPTQAQTQLPPLSGYANGMGLASTGYSYVFPQFLFGRLDNPFFGMEPPLVTYPPWTAAVNAHREAQNVANLNDPGPAAAPAAGNAQPVPANAALLPNGGQLANPIEMTLDSRGNATLRGKVPTFADRVALGQEVARTPGIIQVTNFLEVDPNVRPLVSETPPPPPTPALLPIPAPEAKPSPPVVQDGRAAEKPTILPDGDALAGRVVEAIARRPALATASIRVSTRDGIATLSGNLPSSYEAMLAFRAAQQTPGVRDVIDRLQFPIPDTDQPNPLREKGRPDDVEAYLLAQIRRQVGDLAHVDQVRVHGDALEIRGSVSRADDVVRAEAALRSIPLVRGFRLEPAFVTD